MSDTQPAVPATEAPRTGVRRFGAPGQKVPPFARYEGTSAWRKDRRRVREYNRYRDALGKAETTVPA